MDNRRGAAKLFGSFRSKLKSAYELKKVVCCFLLQIPVSFREILVGAKHNVDEHASADAVDAEAT